MLTKKVRRIKKLLKMKRLRLVIVRWINLVSLSGGCEINILLKLLHILLRSSQPSLLSFILLIELKKLLFLKQIQHSSSSVDKSFVYKLILLIEFAVAVVKQIFYIFASGSSWVINSKLIVINIILILLYSL